MRDGRDDITAGAHGNRNDGSTPGDGGEADRLAPAIWKIIAVAVAGSFMAQLSTTMVNVSLSSLGTELHASLSAIQWVTSGYLLALALMLPLTGWLVDRIGAKALYLRCFVAFTLSSTLCGAAWSANSLIAFRVLQGMSGGLLAPMVQMTMARAAGKHMARVIGYAAVPIMLGPLLGPVIAGAILQFASGAGSFSSTCRSAYWQSYWPFSFCRTTAKRRSAATWIWLGLPCYLPALCSSDLSDALDQPAV